MFTRSQGHSLGYEGSTSLFRTREGIISQFASPWKFNGLINYPTSVWFSPRAMKKVCSELSKHDNFSNIKVYGTLQSGRKVPLFVIGASFFNQRGSDVFEDGYIKRAVGLFKYNSYTDRYSFCCGRCFPFEGDERATQEDDVIASFDAEYFNGNGFDPINERRPFKQRLVPIAELGERIILQLNVDENNDWDLTLVQPTS